MINSSITGKKGIQNMYEIFANELNKHKHQSLNPSYFVEVSAIQTHTQELVHTFVGVSQQKHIFYYFFYFISVFSHS